MKEQASTSHMRWDSDIQMVGIPEILPGFVPLTVADNFFYCTCVCTMEFQYFEYIVSCRYFKRNKFLLISMEQVVSAKTIGNHSDNR